MSEHKIQFGTLHPDGSVTNVRQIKQLDIGKCPHFIMVPEHYNDDGSCKCKDSEAVVMKEWGYKWSDGEWR